MDLSFDYLDIAVVSHDADHPLKQTRHDRGM
jgi:hypothetical protein